MADTNSAQSLLDIIKDKKFVIPMYQRNYKWNTSMAVKLVEDIIGCYNEHGTNPQIKKAKSVGLLTLYHKDGDDNTYYVIDGQQRFTTLSILLSVLECESNIDLTFERDEESNPKRKNAIFSSCDDACTDVNRIKRNKEAIKRAIGEKMKSPIEDNEKKTLSEFVLNHVIMLCSIVSNPIEEFMNLNAYKTAFSISDHIRANLIALNSFYKSELGTAENEAVLARCLSQNSYKTAVAVLYNKIQEKLYRQDKENGQYKSLYALLKEPKGKIIDPKIESRINILFAGMLNGAANYNSGEMTENFTYWMKMLQKLAYVNKLLDELECELDQGEYHSFKQIDDYQKITQKSFILEVFDGIDRRDLDKDWNSQTLAKEIQKYSNIDSVLIKCLSQDSKKLANRYLEAFVYSNVNEETKKKADSETWKKVKLQQMSMDEVVEEISGCGRYIIDRYEREHREDLDTYIQIPPVIDLEDRENINFGGRLDQNEIKEGSVITAGDLFKHRICVPVIQRDYCMGARITGENDFLAFLINGFDRKEKLTASTILIAVSEDENGKAVYIFDGQQRTFTLYNILKWCRNSDSAELKEYSFIGRKHNGFGDCGSPYSMQAVENLKVVLKNKLKDVDREQFSEYIKNNVSLKVKVVNSVSGAEQFFMDINGGVALKKYEIFKSLLCDKLSRSEKQAVVVKIENKWLDFFYRYRKNYLMFGDSDIKKDESDAEELLEIRFIEFVCRFVYRKNHKTDETEECLCAFDEIEAKGEMKAKLSYISNLSADDIEHIEKIMDFISETDLTENNEDNPGIELKELHMQTNSVGGKVFICHLESENEEIDVSNTYYLKRFIWSLLDENRESLQHYYRYKDVGDLIKTYDEDQIMRAILSAEDKKENPYVCRSDVLEPVFYCGYNNGATRYNNDYGTWSIVKIQGEFKKCDKEIPAYYYKEPLPKDKVVRWQYLQEIDDRSESDKLSFALVNNTCEQIKFEDGGKSNICKARNLDTHECRNRTEAYCLRYIQK